MSDIGIKEQIKRIKYSKYYNLVIDESTDIANQKELMIYIKYFDDQDSERKIKFLKLVKLENFTGKVIPKCNICTLFIFEY